MNISDPVDGPSFRPSPLKPIPWCMQAPTDISPRLILHQSSGPRSSYAGTPPPPPRGSSRSGASTLCLSRPTTPVPGRDGSSSAPGLGFGSAACIKDPDTALMRPSPTPIPLQFKRVSTLVKEEPLRHPSSRFNVQRRRSESHASAYLTPPEYADRDGSAGPEPSELVAEIHRLIREKPTESFEYIHSYRTKEAVESNVTAIPQPGDMSRRTTDSAVTTGALESTGGTTLSQLETLSARTSLDMVHRRSRIHSGDSRKVRKAVGTELRKLFSKK